MPANARAPKSNQGPNALVKAERLMEIAFILPAAVLVGWLAGAGLDRWLHQHWIYMAGILLGIIAGFVQIFRLVLSTSDDGAPKEKP